MWARTMSRSGPPSEGASGEGMGRAREGRAPAGGRPGRPGRRRGALVQGRLAGRAGEVRQGRPLRPQRPGVSLADPRVDHGRWRGGGESGQAVMIVRVWRGEKTPPKAHAYLRPATQKGPPPP